jgi:hypothetical protein
MFGVGISHGLTRTHLTHHGPDLGGVTTILPIVLSVPLRRTCIRMALFPGTPKVESRNCPDFGLPGLWDIIASRPNLQLGWGLNQNYSPLRERSNAVSHSPSARRERVDSWLLVVLSQTASLTPGPSFAHNLGCRCPNDQCEAISDVYTSRPFQWHQKHPKARCFAPCCRTLNIRESRRTLNPQLWGVWVSSSHLAKMGLRHSPPLEEKVNVLIEIENFSFTIAIAFFWILGHLCQPLRLGSCLKLT